MYTATGQKTVLIGEDESDIRSYLETSLRCRGYKVRSAADGEEVLQQLAVNSDVNAVLLDIMMPRKDGFGALREIRRAQPHLPVIMLSAMASTSHIVEAMKCGATDFLAKPVSNEEIWRVLDKALVHAPAISPISPDQPPGEMFFGRHPNIVRIRSLLPRVGNSDLPVLIRGETGTGKEVLARQIHAHSPRAGKQFVKLNCAAIPSDLLESELFGYERGAFSGAFQRKAGIFEMASGGTLLLDEIGDMDVRLQAKLLHVLQDRGFRRIGGKEDLVVEVRFIAATHRDLEAGIASGTFREDLYYRLNVMSFSLPPLRERQSEISEVATFMLRRHAPGLAMPSQLVEALEQHDWPGNIRELESVIRRYVVLGDANFIAQEIRTRSILESTPSPVPAAPVAHAVTRESSGTPLEEASHAKRRAEAEAITTALNATRWNRKQAATLLKIDYKALLYKMKKLAIDSGSRVTE